jgi:hypothetical protein
MTVEDNLADPDARLAYARDLLRDSRPGRALYPPVLPALLAAALYVEWRLHGPRAPGGPDGVWRGERLPYRGVPSPRIDRLEPAEISYLNSLDDVAAGEVLGEAREVLAMMSERRAAELLSAWRWDPNGGRGEPTWSPYPPPAPPARPMPRQRPASTQVGFADLM